jgi:hypothetical protein
MNATPHVAQNAKGCSSAIDGRTTRHSGYAVSQRIRKRIEESFGWMKTVAGQERTKFRGREEVCLRSRAVGHRRLAIIQRRGPRPWDRAPASARVMEEQSSGEFASADAAAGAQDAAVQESGFGAETSLHARRGLQHL